MKFLKTCLIALTLTFPFISTAARADSFTSGNYYSGDQNNFVNGEITYTLNGTTSTGAAGNLTGSTGVIGGKSINFLDVFCVDLADDIFLGTTYNATYSQDGSVKGSPVNNAGQISWLMQHIGPTLTDTASNEGLQAAIWSVEYPTFSLPSASNDPAVIAAFNADLAALGSNTASVSSVRWITVNNADGSFAQAQVGLTPTPEPSSLMLLGTGLVGVAATLRRRVLGSASRVAA